MDLSVKKKRMEEANYSLLVVKSGVDIMKDAIFQEIVTCVESNGIILALLEGSKEVSVLQQIVDTLHTVRVLGLTHDSCRILVSHQMDATNGEENLTTKKSDSEKVNLMAAHDIPSGEGMNHLSNVTLEERVRNALFGEVVQSIAKNECSLIMATGVRSDETLQTALEILGNARIIYLAPDACEVLLVNRLKPSKRKSTGRSKSSGKTLAEEKTCHLCKKQFSKRSGLLTHQKAFHDKYLPHKCDLCDKAFVYPKELRMHKLSHTGKRPYHCHICNKGFIARKDVQRHQPVHTGERAFVCDICKATFAHKANLDRHVKSKHEGRRPYICSLCVDKKYCDRGGLRKHLVSVHRIFDVPRKKVVHRMIPREMTDTVNINNVQTIQSQNEDVGKAPDLIQIQNFAPNQDVALGGETVMLRELDASGATAPYSIAKTLSPPLAHADPNYSDSQTVKSASKILQQLSQNIAELSGRQSAAHHNFQQLHDLRGPTFSISGNSIVVPTIVEDGGSGNLMTTQSIAEHSGGGGALINIVALSSASEEAGGGSETMNVEAVNLNRLKEIQTGLQIGENPSNMYN